MIDVPADILVVCARVVITCRGGLPCNSGSDAREAAPHLCFFSARTGAVMLIFCFASLPPKMKPPTFLKPYATSSLQY